MNIAIVMAKAKNLSYPGKNIAEIGGRPCCWYPMRAGQLSKTIDQVYAISDSPMVGEIAQSLGITWVPLPSEFTTPTAQIYNSMRYGVQQIVKDLPAWPKVVVNLMGNAPTLREGLIDEAVTKLLDEQLDSVITAIPDNNYHPFRNKWLGVDGRLQTWDIIGPVNHSQNRQELTPQYMFLTHNIWALRAAVAFAPHPKGQMPWPFMGENIGWVCDETSAHDMHHPEDIPLVENWLQRHGQWMLTPPAS